MANKNAENSDIIVLLFCYIGMQNLAIACALVCLILLGAAIVVGLFGILRRQISAVVSSIGVKNFLVH